MLLGEGTPLFGRLGPDAPRVELVSAIDSPKASHLRYRVVR
jgi:hypothetical protein